MLMKKKRLEESKLLEKKEKAMSDPNTKLTTNFKLKEFLCPCCGKGEGIISMKLVRNLQKLRDLINHYSDKEVKIIVESGYRCSKHNISKAVGGAPESKHLDGIAVDIYFDFMDKNKSLDSADMLLMTEEIQAFRDGGIGIYPESDNRMIHLDVRGYKARWVRSCEEYISLPKWIIGDCA